MIPLLRRHAANAITCARVLLACGVVVAVGIPSLRSAASLPALIVLAFALDGVDGAVARKLGATSLLGSFFDIAADRIIEFLFILVFAHEGAIPLWFLLVFYIRVVLADVSRYYAFRTGRVGASGILLPGGFRPLVLHPISRTTYGAMKAALFAYLFLSTFTVPALQNTPSHDALVLSGLLAILAMSLARGLPIICRYGLEALATARKQVLQSNDLVVLRLGRSLGGARHEVDRRGNRALLWQVALDVAMAAAVLVVTSMR